MKTLYIFLLLLLLLLVWYYFTNKKENFMHLDDLESTKNKFKFITDNTLDLSDDFGDIVKDNLEKPLQEISLKEYREGFEGGKQKERFTQEQKVRLLPKTNTPRYVFTYWENKGDRTEPYAHIKLCFETMKKKYGKYNFVILNPDTIKEYLPNLRDDLGELMIAQKVDYYRVALLYYYGGIWIDADTIALRNLDEVFDKLDNGYDYVGFGCTGKICFNGYPEPSNWVMASRKNGRLMKCCLDKLNKMLDQNNKKYKYFELGKNVIWDCLEELKDDYDYYHFPAEYDGSRDFEGKWIHSPNHLSKEPTKFIDENKAFFAFLANYELANDKENKWFVELDEKQIVNGPWWVSSLFRKALKN